jgi:hypothetical protein
MLWPFDSDIVETFISILSSSLQYGDITFPCENVGVGEIFSSLC